MAMNKKEKDGIVGLKNDVGGLKNSMGEMKSSMGEMKSFMGEMKSFMEELRRHMGVLVEGLRSEIRVVAEQYGSIVNRLDGVDAKLEEHDRRFDVIDIDLKAIKGGLFEFSHRLDKHEKSELAN